MLIVKTKAIKISLSIFDFLYPKEVQPTDLLKNSFSIESITSNYSKLLFAKEVKGIQSLISW